MNVYPEHGVLNTPDRPNAAVGIQLLARLFLLVGVMITIAACPLLAAVTTYPNLPVDLRSDYRLKSNSTYTASADGNNLQVVSVVLDDGAGNPAPKSVCGFGFDNSVTVRVRPNFGWSDCRILPTQYGVPVERQSDGSVTFTLNDNTKGKVYVEFDYDLNKSLIVFADPPPPPVPQGAIYYGPGHRTGDVYLGSDQTAYFAPGCVIEGNLHYNGNNIKAIGRGWFLGNTGSTTNWGGTVTNAEFSGLHIAGWGRWTVNFWDSSYVNLSHIKTLFENNESDGLSFNGSNNCTARHMFMMQGDDFFTPQKPSAYNLLVENVVANSDGGNLFCCGTDTGLGGNIVYRDIYVVKVRNNFITVNWSNVGFGDIGGMTIENVYVDDRSQMQSFIYFNNVTKIGTRYFTLRNIVAPSRPSTVTSVGGINMTFDDVYLGGVQVVDQATLRLYNEGNNNYTFLDAPSAVSNGIYRIINQADFARSRVLEVGSAAIANPNGATTNLWDWNGGGWQRWNVQSLGNNQFRLDATHSGQSLDAYNNDIVGVWNPNGANNQKWNLTGNGDGTYRIQSVQHPGYTLSAHNDVAIGLWYEWFGGAQQRWAFEPMCLTATYFDNSNFSGATHVRRDKTVDFNWGTASPMPGRIAADTFSVRWTGKIIPKHSQGYTFYVKANDGVRLWVNGVKVIDRWTNVSATTENASGTINLKAGKQYAIKLEYYDNAGNASCQLLWSSASQPKQVIPVEATLPY